MKKTGAKLVWCPTTPVPNNSIGNWAQGRFGRRKDEDLVFNQAAMQVISKYPEIAVNDINSFIRESAEFAEWRKQSDVHFWGNESETLGKAVAKGIQKILTHID